MTYRLISKQQGIFLPQISHELLLNSIPRGEGARVKGRRRREEEGGGLGGGKTNDASFLPSFLPSSFSPSSHFPDRTLFICGAADTDQGEESVVLVVVGGGGDHFSVSHVEFFGVWKGKNFVSKVVWKDKNFVSKVVWKDKNFVSKGVWKDKNFVSKGVWEGKNFVKNTIFHAADQWKYPFRVFPARRRATYCFLIWDKGKSFLAPHFAIKPTIFLDNDESPINGTKSRFGSFLRAFFRLFQVSHTVVIVERQFFIAEKKGNCESSFIKSTSAGD